MDLSQSLSAVMSSVVPYIAGFVAHKVRAVPIVRSVLLRWNQVNSQTFITAKNRGGLVTPSKDILEICSTAEKGPGILQHQCKNLKFLNTRSESLLVDVVSAVFEKALLAQLESHLLDCDPLDDHIYIAYQRK